MNPTRKRRLWLVLALVVAAGIATALVALALQRNVAYLYTPSEVLTAARRAVRRPGALPPRRHGRGGLVHARAGLDGSALRVDDGDAQTARRLHRHPPDLFREKQAVVATGRMRGGTFVAEEVLAKHDETYMPKEVADKMGKAHRKHDVAPTPAACPRRGAQ
jgi:cytochrome c-type biogenesis protein CcmE